MPGPGIRPEHQPREIVVRIERQDHVTAAVATGAQGCAVDQRKRNRHGDGHQHARSDHDSLARERVDRSKPVAERNAPERRHRERCRQRDERRRDRSIRQPLPLVQRAATSPQRDEEEVERDLADAESGKRKTPGIGRPLP